MHSFHVSLRLPPTPTSCCRGPRAMHVGDEAASKAFMQELGAPSKVYRLGLTGSIGMGKTTVGRFFAKENVPVLDADEAFPAAIVDEAVSRPELAKQVVGNKVGLPQAYAALWPPKRMTPKPLWAAQEALKALEGLVHPLVLAERQRWLGALDPEQTPLAVLDIPLLYETQAESTVDAVVVVTASEAAQRERVLRRPGMTPEKFEAILARQMPDHEKRERADYLIHTGCSLQYTEDSVRDLLEYLRLHKL